MCVHLKFVYACPRYDKEGWLQVFQKKAHPTCEVSMLEVNRICLQKVDIYVGSYIMQRCPFYRSASARANSSRNHDVWDEK